MSRGSNQWVKRHSNQAKPIIILAIFYISLISYLIYSKLIKLDKFSLLANVLIFSSLALATSAGLRLIQKNNLNIFEATKQEISKLKVTLLDNKKSLFLSLSLSLIFYALYLTLGILLKPDYIDSLYDHKQCNDNEANHYSIGLSRNTYFVVS